MTCIVHAPYSGYLSSAEKKTVPAHGKALVDTQLSIAVPAGTYGRVAPRSGLGVIDADYRGVVFVLLFNYSDKDFEVEEGDRVAQLIIERILTPEILVVEARITFTFATTSMRPFVELVVSAPREDMFLFEVPVQTTSLCWEINSLRLRQYLPICYYPTIMAEKTEAYVHSASCNGSLDTESGPHPKPEEHGEHKLVRQLKNRHIAMISQFRTGVIGTGLFLSTGKSHRARAVHQVHFYLANALRFGGPVGLLLGYLAVGSITYSVMISLGEMIAYLPIPGGHIKLAERFVDPAFSFTMGWNYWYNWTVVLPAELSAAYISSFSMRKGSSTDAYSNRAVLINYWNKSVNNAAWVTIVMVIVIAINMCGAGVYGEAEFIFASIKVVTVGIFSLLEARKVNIGQITGLIVFGLVLDLGELGFDTGRILVGSAFKQEYGRLNELLGPFVQYRGISGAKGRFLGWWAVMTQAAFSYIGTEIVAIAAGEAKNPRRNLPKAIRRVYIRILLFYIGQSINAFLGLSALRHHIGGVIIIGLLVPSSDPGLNLGDGTAASSPFVIAIQRSGIKTLPSVGWDSLRFKGPSEQAVPTPRQQSDVNGATQGRRTWWTQRRQMSTSSFAAAGRHASAGVSPARQAGLTGPWNADQATYTLVRERSVSLRFLSLFDHERLTAQLRWLGGGWQCTENLLENPSEWSSHSLTVILCGIRSSGLHGRKIWFREGICVTYIRFYEGMKAQGYARKHLPFASALQPYAAWYGMVFCLLICFFSGWATLLHNNWDVAIFITNYLPFVLFPILYGSAKLYYWRKGKTAAWVKAEDMDFVTNIAEIEADS
ncbi:amino acid permease [Mycena crocata]|nr:amino acid permease [Mycena crocata]